MNNNYYIKIDGIQKTPQDENKVTLMTKGSFIRRGGSYFISYEETEATGYGGCTTTVKIDAKGKVSMMRFGDKPSHLIIEKGQRHLCHYDTGFGPLSLGISADDVDSSLTSIGGRLKFSYSLDINSSNVSTNTVDITVKEAFSDALKS